MKTKLANTNYLPEKAQFLTIIGGLLFAMLIPFGSVAQDKIDMDHPQTYYGQQTLDYFISMVKRGEEDVDLDVKGLVQHNGSSKIVWVRGVSWDGKSFSGEPAESGLPATVKVDKKNVVDWKYTRTQYKGSTRNIVSLGSFSNKGIYVGHGKSGDPILDQMLIDIQKDYLTNQRKRRIAQLGIDLKAAPPKKDKVYEKKDLKSEPEFPGGNMMMKRFLQFEINKKALKGKSGRVLVSAVVDRQGNLSDFKLEEKLDDASDNEALRLVKKMPAWIPGVMKDTPVRSKVIISVSFS